MKVLRIGALFLLLVGHAAFTEEGPESRFPRKTFLPLLADKSAELLQVDLCRAFMSYFGREPNLCDVAENLPLSKATAKGLGAATRAWQSSSTPYIIATALASGYLGTRFFDFTLGVNTNLVQAIVLASFAPFGHLLVSDPGFTKWLGDPIVSKAASLGSKLLLEKRIEEFLFSTASRAAISAFFAAYLGDIVSQRENIALAKAVPAGVAKVVASLVAFAGSSVPSLVSDDVNWTKLYEKLHETFVVSVCQGFVIAAIMIVASPGAAAMAVLAINMLK